MNKQEIVEESVEERFVKRIMDRGATSDQANKIMTLVKLDTEGVRYLEIDWNEDSNLHDRFSYDFVFDWYVKPAIRKWIKENKSSEEVKIFI